MKSNIIPLINHSPINLMNEEIKEMHKNNILLKKKILLGCIKESRKDKIKRIIFQSDENIIIQKIIK